jgi:hypothetical protein
VRWNEVGPRDEIAPVSGLGGVPNDNAKPCSSFRADIFDCGDVLSHFSPGAGFEKTDTSFPTKSYPRRLRTLFCNQVYTDCVNLSAIPLQSILLSDRNI